MKDNLLPVETIAKVLKDRKLYVISEVTGLTFPTLKKLAEGRGKNCNYKTLSTISRYIKENK